MKNIYRKIISIIIILAAKNFEGVKKTSRLFVTDSETESDYEEDLEQKSIRWEHERPTFEELERNTNKKNIFI